MRLSPLDIQHIEFERSVSGYRPAQVRAFLERVAAEREELLKEAQGLRDRAADQQRRIEALEAAEADLRHAVVAAERIANQMRENARQEAKIIVQEAESERRAQHAELARLRELRDRFREQFRGMLQAYEASLDAHVPRADGASADAPSDGERLSEQDLHDGDETGPRNPDR
ncbi:MAG: DivIVA domain-containing protein [Trueperaceae bacterium]